MSTVMIVGCGAIGAQLATHLSPLREVRSLVLCGRTAEPLTRLAARLPRDGLRVRTRRVDATMIDEVARCLREDAPDLVVISAAAHSPWLLLGRDDRPARAIASAGLGLRLPYLARVPLQVMRAVRQAGHHGPIANMCFPDVTGPMLAGQGLAPTLGLGNVGMLLLRARQAQRGQAHREHGLIRILGHHSQVPDVMRGAFPADPARRCRVYVREGGHRDDELPYLAPPRRPGAEFDEVTIRASIPVLKALLPGARPLRWSTPAPHGLPGGYPVRIAERTVALDLPADLDPDQAMAINAGWSTGDGIDRIDATGTVHYSAAARDAVAGVDPRLAAPLAIGELQARAALLDHHLGLAQQTRS